MTLHVALSLAGIVATTAVAAPKPILIQEFTATWCPHCRNAADGIVQLLEADPDSLVGMMLHFGDAYTTPLSEELIDFYGLPGHPMIWVDGAWSQIGSTGNGDANAASIGALVDNASTTTDVIIDVTGTQNGSTDYTLDVSVEVEAGGEPRAMRVYITQVYTDTAWPEPGEMQFNTQRQSAPTQAIALDPGESWATQHTFTLTDESLNTDFVRYIVWAQDDLAAPPAMVRQVAVHDHGDAPPCDCPADLDCNGVVDVDDLLQVLGAWGTDGGDTDDDGDTDVDDLLALIAAWGAC